MGMRVRGKATARPEKARGPTLRVGVPGGGGRPTPSLKCRCRAKVEEGFRRSGFAPSHGAAERRRASVFGRKTAPVSAATRLAVTLRLRSVTGRSRRAGAPRFDTNRCGTQHAG